MVIESSSTDALRPMPSIAADPLDLAGARAPSLPDRSDWTFT